MVQCTSSHIRYFTTIVGCSGKATYLAPNSPVLLPGYNKFRLERDIIQEVQCQVVQ